MVKLDPRFSKTEFAVEGDSFVYHALWGKYSTETLYKTPMSVVRWEEDCMGTVTQIGYLDTIGEVGGRMRGRPININFRWAKLNGHSIMFYDPCSQLVDYKMVEDWLDKYTKFRRCDANNFHNVLELIKAFPR
jgi:hypothetical protein